MTTAQKIIKYLAIALAISIIVSIFSAIAGGIFGLASVLGLRKNKAIGEMKAIDFENSEVATLDIDVAFTNLTIKTGETLKAETNNSNINCKQNYQNLQIKEKSRKWFGNNGEGDLVVYVPKNIEFETIRINAGAGKINIESLNTKDCFLRYHPLADTTRENNSPNNAYMIQCLFGLYKRLRRPALRFLSGGCRNSHRFQYF